MNERIAKLMEQAQISSESDRGGNEYFKAWPEDFQQFVELIVKECAAVVDDKTYPTGFGQAAGWCEGNDLLKHFGV